MVLTNKDKYLKDGVDIQEFLDRFQSFYMRKGNEILTNKKIALDTFLKEEIKKPTLTEDEKVILRNIGSYKEIGRDNDGDLYLQDDCKQFINSLFGHLFQFIQPRRRI